MLSILSSIFFHLSALLESSQTVTQDFINEMKNQYPYELSNLDLTDIEPLYDHILQSHITWGNETSLDKVIGEGSVIFAANTTNVTNIRVRRATNFDSSVTKVIGNQTRSYHNSHVDDHPIEEVLAHAFHKASISILCILALEVDRYYHSIDYCFSSAPPRKSDQYFGQNIKKM